jgi:hypothetical protein
VQTPQQLLTWTRTRCCSPPHAPRLPLRASRCARSPSRSPTPHDAPRRQHVSTPSDSDADEQPTPCTVSGVPPSDSATMGNAAHRRHRLVRVRGAAMRVLLPTLPAACISVVHSSCDSSTYCASSGCQTAERCTRRGSRRPASTRACRHASASEAAVLSAPVAALTVGAGLTLARALCRARVTKRFWASGAAPTARSPSAPPQTRRAPSPPSAPAQTRRAPSPPRAPARRHVPRLVIVLWETDFVVPVDVFVVSASGSAGCGSAASTSLLAISPMIA